MKATTEIVFHNEPLNSNKLIFIDGRKIIYEY